jgi:hypothetical protein
MSTAQSQVTWDDVRRKMNLAAAAIGEWAGAPVPVDHVRLVMEPRYPFKGLSGLKLGEKRREESPDDAILINSWNCPEKGGHVIVYRENGKVGWCIDHQGPGQRWKFWFDTFACAAQQIWSIETETRAMEKLKDLVTEQAYRCYVLSGTFIETSKRSGVTYFFRKLRPTIAMRPNKENMMRILAILCLHPLGYYEGTWAGVMTPTDDVIAHLVWMRGNEHGFWKKANHHSIWNASSGI